MIRAFTNRRRAKDALIAIGEMHGYDDVAIVAKEGMVYISAPDSDDVAAIMHFGSPVLMSLGQIEADSEEAYHGESCHRFRF